MEAALFTRSTDADAARTELFDFTRGLAKWKLVGEFIFGFGEFLEYWKVADAAVSGKVQRLLLIGAILSFLCVGETTY